MNTGPLPKPRHDPEMDNYIFGGGPKRKSAEGDKTSEVALPKPRHDPEMDNYIFGGGPKRK
jgi:hypothetical protein